MKKVLLTAMMIGLSAVPLIASYEEQKTTPIPFSYFTGGGLFKLSSKCYIASRLERKDRASVTDYESSQCYWTCSEDVYRNICEPLRRKRQKWDCVTIRVAEPGKLVIESRHIQKPEHAFYPEYWSIAGAGVVEDVRSAAPALAPAGYYEGTRWCVTVDRATTLTMSVDYGLTDSHHSPCFDKFAFYPTSGRTCCLCPMQRFALNDGFVNVSGGSYRSGSAVRLEASVPFGQSVKEWRFFRGQKQFSLPKGAVQTERSIEFVMPDEWCGTVEDESEMMVSVVLAGADADQAVAFSCPALTDASLTVGVVGSGEGIPLVIEPLSAVKSVKASKLPSGMKLVKDKETGLYAITGSPKKAGYSEVVFTLTTVSGSKQTLTVPIRVEALPSWATGIFGGLVGRSVGIGENEEFHPYGTVDLKVMEAGKITAKVAAGGKSYSFTANGYESVGEHDGHPFCRFALKTKKGDVYEGEITAAGHDVMTLMTGGHVDAEGEFTPAGKTSYRAVVWRNEHGNDGHLSDDQTGRAATTMDAIKALKKVELADYDPVYGSAVLTIGKDGSTKLLGTTADGVKLGGKGFLKLEDASCHVIADTVVYDKKSGNVYVVTVCWQPLFDGSGKIVGWDESCCNHALRVYPFE